MKRIVRVMPARADGVMALSGFPSGCSALPLFPVSPNSCLFSSLQLGCKNPQQPKTLATSGVWHGGSVHRLQRGVAGCAHQFGCTYVFGSLFAPVSGHAPGRRKGAYPKFGCGLQAAADGLQALLSRWVSASPALLCPGARNSASDLGQQPHSPPQPQTTDSLTPIFWTA